MSLEIEIKYLLLKTELLKCLDLATCASVWIEQFYFSPQKIQELLLPVLKASGQYDLTALTLPCQNGRVRMSQGVDTLEYSLTVKAPRENLFSRLELEITIDLALFEQLKNQADYGCLKKRRYQYTGHLDSNNGLKDLIAEIDEYHEIAGVAVAIAADQAFLVVEIEAESEDDLLLIRQGKHDFKFLAQAIELLSLPENLQPYFKNTYIARAGLNLEQVTEVCKRLPRTGS